MSFPPWILLQVGVTGVFLSLIATGLAHRTRPGAASATGMWVALGVLTAIVALGQGGYLHAQTTITAVGMGWFMVVPLWAGFAFEYTGRGPSLTGRWLWGAILYVGLAVIVTRWGGDIGAGLGPLLRVVASLLQTGLIGAGLFGVFLIGRSSLTYDDIPTGQAIALSVGGLGTSMLLFSVSTVGVDPTGPPPLITGFLAVTAGGFGVGVYGYKAFEDTPGIGSLARRSALEEMSEAVVVADRSGRLVDANTAAEHVFGLRLPEDAGRPIEDTLAFDPETIGKGPVSVPTPHGHRRFTLSRSQLSNAQGDTVGQSYLFQDVTGQRTRRQRLEVFNRVLRHNLRNDLDAIRGFAEALPEVADDPTTDVAERIQTTATDLVELGATVERADRVMTQDTLTPREIDIESVVASITRTVSDLENCHIETTCEVDESTVWTDRDVLEIALLEIIENAIEHSPQSVPEVVVTITADQDAVRVAVRDEGPGIPERERAVLLDGEETPLQHGTGVGLWLVSWAVTRLGGDLSVREFADRGSEVRISLPRRGAGSTSGIS